MVTYFTEFLCICCRPQCEFHRLTEFHTAHWAEQKQEAQETFTRSLLQGPLQGDDHFCFSCFTAFNNKKDSFY